MLEYLGLLLVFASWEGGYYIVTKWRDTSLPTISRHAASNRQALQIFIAVVVGLGALLYYWLMTWFVPHLRLSGTFEILLTLTIIFQILTGLIPDTTGWSRKLHHLAAYLMALLYLPLSILIIQSPVLGTLLKVLCALLVAYMFISMVLVGMMGKAKEKYLYFQAGYIVAFQLIILVAAYL